MGKLLILIPTYNRHQAIDFYIGRVLDSLKKYHVDMLVCDSSTDDETREIVNAYQASASGRLQYQRYSSELYEEKVYQAISSISKDYEYLWICSDSYVLNVEEIYPNIEAFLDAKVDIIHIDELDRDQIGNKQYHNCKELFRECFFRMLLYGGTIINRRVFDTVLDQRVFEKYSGTGLYYQAALMEYCAYHEFTAFRFYYKRHYTINPFKKKSEWADRAVWQWSENWYNVVNKLPTIFNEEKSEVLKSSEMFSIVGLIRLRYFRGLTVRMVRKYEKYIKLTSKSNMAFVYLISVLPISWIAIPRKLYRWMKNLRKII